MFVVVAKVFFKEIKQYQIRDITSLRINLSLKTVQLSPPIFGQFCEKTNILFFPYIPRITNSYNIFCKKKKIVLRKASIFVILT